MSDSTPLLLTKLGARSERDLAAGFRSGHLPPVLLEKVPGRLRLLSTFLLATLGVSWFGVNLVEGELLSEFEAVQQWSGPVAMIVGAVVMLVLCRGPLLRPEALARVGLGFQVLVSWAICVATYWGAFVNVPTEALSSDLVGLSPVVLWMMGYTALVPSTPTSAIVGLLGSAAAMPVIYQLNVLSGLAPRLRDAELVGIFVLPYLVCVALCYLMARVIFRLGRDIRRAHELGSYRLREVIGRGGMGEVWRADHAMLARPAAIKLINPEVLGSGDSRVEAAIARFQREAHITASLQSPHTVELYDFGVSADGTLYYVMELLDGIDLQTLVERHGPLTPARVVHILVQVCASLSEAHRRGLIHRDIKPANILLCRWALEHDFVKVLDFGLAKQHAGPSERAQPGVTGANVVLGTPAFMAPEQALGEEAVDGRADIYALGCVAHWLLTGTPLFDEGSPMAMLVAQVSREPTAPSAQTTAPVPAGLDGIVLSCLAKEREERPASAEALARALLAIDLETPWTPEQAADWWEAIPSTAGAASEPRAVS